MIIISQERDTIINFDNTCAIRLYSVNGITEVFVDTYLNDSDLIATYKTEERAKEVLEEIVSYYCRKDYAKPLEPLIGIGEIMSRDKAAFYMPLE